MTEIEANEMAETLAMRVKIRQTERRIDGMISAHSIWYAIPWMRPTDLDAFTTAYVECALWSSTYEDYQNGRHVDIPMDRDYSIDDIADETLGRMVADCDRFQQIADWQRLQIEFATNEDCTWESFRITAINPDEGDCESYAGHDFWLTRNGHGAGFWDGDWEADAGEQLTKLSKSFGECDLYVGDDGKIYS